jgi:hypothetical protein
MVRVLLELLQQ